MTEKRREAPVSGEPSRPAREPVPAASRGLPMLWPFLTGTVFVLLILLITVLGGQPSPEQFTIYRIVIALGGAGFAVALTGQLEVMIPLLRNGLIKATAGFAVFVILYFFSPAALVVDDGELEVRQMRIEYQGGRDPGDEAAPIVGRATPVARARLAIDAQFEDALAQAYASGNCDGDLPVQDCNTTEAVLKRTKAVVERTLAAESESFGILNSFHLALFDCVDDGNCDRDAACGAFIEDIERFRQTFCDRLMRMAEVGESDTWSRHRQFSQGDCGPYFVDHYVKRPTTEGASADLYDGLAGVCLPTQCWARNMTPPYPCDVRRDAGRPQLVGGVAAP